MHKCKLCFRSFNNGRALGGHMRSHMMNLTKQEEDSSRSRVIQLSFEAESTPSSSSTSSENPEFSGSMILQDRESETESSKNNPTRKRSKRVWKIGRFDPDNNYCSDRKSYHHRVRMYCPPSKTESLIDIHEPVSSVSDATTEEDVAFCLMMLSRDKWKKQKDQQYEEEKENKNDADVEEQEEDDDGDGDGDGDSDNEFEVLVKESKNRLRRGRYKCETCNKVFRSYQALGGHRASHKKIKVEEAEFEGGGSTGVVEKKIHECPVCFRVFASGQALGGHKRTHVNGSLATTTITTVPVFSSTKLGNSFIDLNLPAPIDDDDVSQIDNSAVSDAEFLKSIT